MLRPFQAASAKFMQATLLARETAARQRVQTSLDLQDEVYNAEQDAHRATMAAIRRHLGSLGQQANGSLEEMFAARARAQAGYEQELRQICTDTQGKLAAIAQRAASTAAADQARLASGPQQDSYRAYLSDLQQAWSNTKVLDPQTMNAIASNILFTMTAVSQWG
ncbi:MAG TPA: hypothetical protein VF469_18690 [Kofleriaceae bacterium]